MLNLFKSRKWCLLDLVVGDDGKLVLTKLQAACFHAAMFLTVSSIQVARIVKFWRSPEADIANLFDAAMWGLYAAFAVGHAVVDKEMKSRSEFKNKKLDMDAAPGTVETETTVKETVTKP